jgi:hypothetical protein
LIFDTVGFGYELDKSPPALPLGGVVPDELPVPPKLIGSGFEDVRFNIFDI